MPIKGLTDRDPYFPEIGQLRKGSAKDDSKNMPGKDLTYFRVTFNRNEAAAEEIFYKLYGKEPNDIRAVLPFNEIERMWDSWLEAYTAGRMVARADGEYFAYLVDTNTGEILIKNYKDKEGKKKPYIEGQEVGKDYKGNPIYCKPVGRLKVLIPEFSRAAYMTILTTSVNDIASISSELKAIQESNKGIVKGVPLIISRKPEMVSCPTKDGKRVRREKWLLHIEVDPYWMKALLIEQKRLALPGNVFGELTAEQPLLEEGEEWEVDVESTTMEVAAEDPTERQEDPCWVEPPTEEEVVVPQDDQPVTLPVNRELAAALSLCGSDQKPYRDCTIDELERKTKAINHYLQTETDADKAAQLTAHIDALKLVKEYRTKQQPAAKPAAAQPTLV